MKKISLFFCITSALIFSNCTKSSDKPASPINCDNLITDTAGTNDSARIFTLTAFSPNGDGLNDRYRVLCVQIASVDLKVYDENNKIVFSSNAINSGGWTPVVTTNTYAKYYYRIQAITTSNRKIGTCGDLYLVNCVPANVDKTLFLFEDQLTQNGFTNPTMESLADRICK